MFLNKTEDTEGNHRSLVDPWELNGPLLFEPQVLLDTIIDKYGEMATVYSNIATLYRRNLSWWNRWRLTFQKWWEVVDDEYNPLHDKDYFEYLDDQIKDNGSSNTRNKQYDSSKGQSTKESTNNDTIHNSAHDQELSADSRFNYNNGTSDNTNSKESHGNNTEFDASVGYNNNVRVPNINVLHKSEVDKVDSNSTNYKSAYDDNTAIHDDNQNANDGFATTGWTTHDKNNTHVRNEQEINDTTTGNEQTEDKKKEKSQNTIDTIVGEYGEDNTKTSSKTNEGGSSNKTENHVSSSVADNTYGEINKQDNVSNMEGTSSNVTENVRSAQQVKHTVGNAGIYTTSQKLMEQELRIRFFNLYEHMADIFADEMLVRVWL